MKLRRGAIIFDTQMRNHDVLDRQKQPKHNFTIFSSSSKSAQNTLLSRTIWYYSFKGNCPGGENSDLEENASCGSSEMVF